MGEDHEHREEHCLVVSAAGGMATLAMPDEQRIAGIREQVLRTHLGRENVEDSTPELFERADATASGTDD